MLIELQVRDYAVIDDLSLEFRSGLNVLSGETGAGKSIIVGALSLLVGDRASVQAVRQGSDRATVEAVFDVSRVPELEESLARDGFPLDNGLVHIRREVVVEGRNRAWINGSPATAALVRQLGSRLLDIHGQHEHQTLLRPEAQQRILDALSGATEQANEVRSLFHRKAALVTKIAAEERRLADLAERADLLRFQVEEIEATSLEEGEEDRLDLEGRKLANAEDLARGAAALHDGLYGGEDALTDRAAALLDRLKGLASLDPSLSGQVETLEEAYHLLSDTGQRVGAFASDVEFDPARLEEIRERQDLIFRLKRKYGPSVSDILEWARAARSELDELDNASSTLEQSEKEVSELDEALDREAGHLSRLRREGAIRLQEGVADLLPSLGLVNGQFEVHLDTLDSPGAGGKERVEFLVSLNPGFAPGPLASIASGGELSRIMLALKSILSEVDDIPSLVFDEIDAGIGGQVAVQVAKNLKDVAKRHQVFVITHLAQLAAKADHQFRVEKDEVGGMASTTVRKITGEARVEELARMLGGDGSSDIGLSHARSLLSED